MKYLYFMSTFCQAICNGKYVFVIRSGFVKTQHSPYGSAARKLFVKHKQVTIINHGDEELIKIFVKGAASWKRKTYRTPDFITGRFDDRSTELSTNIAKDFEPNKTKQCRHPRMEDGGIVIMRAAKLGIYG